MGMLTAADYGENGSWIWWEAEDAISMNLFTATSTNDKGKEVLSGGKWIGTESNKRDGVGFLEYDIEVKKGATFDFFTRKFWKHGPFRWRFDSDEWKSCTKAGTVLLDSVELKKHWGANWVPLGEVKLDAGLHKLRIELLEDTGVAYFDAFLLAKMPFNPRGKMKPDEGYPPAPEGWFNFEPKPEVFADTALIDMRYLNEKEAGEGGFIKAENGRFIQSRTGKPIRFLGVGTSSTVMKMPHRYIDSHARFLAKRGVNLARFHSAICKRRGTDAFGIDEDTLDNLFYYQAALKKQGIYMHFSIYFQHWMRFYEVKGFESYNTPKYRNQKPFAIHFFDPLFWSGMENWWKQLLTRKNPYTGLRLADDPAVLGVELINEDSFFFWTFKNGVMPKDRTEALEHRFHTWLINKYGSLEEARKAWENETKPTDKNAVEGISVMDIWYMRGSPDRDPSQRQLDTIRFLTEVQIGFFTHFRDYIRNELGFKGLMCSSNWKTADPVYLEPVEKLTNLETDFMDYHGYFGAPGKRLGGSFLPAAGDLYAPRSFVRMDPGKSKDKKKFFGEPGFQPAFMDMVYNDQPSMVSEWTANGQNKYRGELPIVAGAMFSQGGIDAPCYFAMDSVPGWLNSEHSHWPVQSPAEMGQFPVMALIFRQEMVRETEPVVEVTMSREDVLNLKGSPIVAANSQDANRTGEGGVHEKKVFDFRAFAVGKVKMNIIPEGKYGVVMKDLAQYDNAETKRLYGMNRETVLDYGRHVYEVRTPKAQAAVGFLGAAGPVDLGDVVIETGLEHAAIGIVSMDGKPIRESGKILLSVFTEQRNAGFKDELMPDGSRKYIDIGKSPIQLREAQGTISLKREDAGNLKVYPCSVDGYPIGDPVKGASQIRLKSRVLHYVIQQN